ncbi:hypothetical protein [Actinoplanes awajinensis]|uniref:hypothetical protein n=1 Tax=Actinoplanes awajinensis TaxID=135946 RepID=UPI000AE7E26C|nr:hypothetical protein [Actinoplanes awajinensis]
MFSWSEGHRKPDQRLCSTVTARIGVPAAECLPEHRVDDLAALPALLGRPVTQGC